MTPGRSSTAPGPNCVRVSCSRRGGARTTAPDDRPSTSTSRPPAGEHHWPPSSPRRRPGPGIRVEPLGTIEDDPNVTDKRFPGNPTRSYRTTEPLRVLEEITGWDPPPAAMIQHMRERMVELAELGIEAVDD